MQNLDAIDVFMSSRFPSPDNTGAGCPHVQKQVRDAIAQSHFKLDPQKIDSTPKVLDFMRQNGVSEKAISLYQWMTQFVGTPYIVIPRGIRMLKWANIPDETVVSPAICRSPEMAAMLMPVFGIQITLGEIRKMVDEAEKWIESRKMNYVWDFWNILRQDNPKNILAKLDPRFHDENVSIDDKIYLLSSASAVRFNEILQSWYDALYKRPDVIDFKQADNIFTVGRGDLNNGAVGHDASHNIGTIVSTGLGSAMTFAWRSLQVVGKIAPGADKDAKILADVFEKSQDHLLARLSTETHTFISLLQFFIQQPLFRKRILELAQAGTLDGSSINRTMQEEGVKYAHKIMDRRKRLQSQPQTLTEINQEAAFDEELYEVFPDGTVRVREKVIQFIRYLGSLQARQAGTAIKTTGCPMANLKREWDEGANMLYVQEFSRMMLEVFRAAFDAK